MNEDRPVFSPALRIAIIAILAAVTTVFTLFVRVPSPAKGYFNLADVAIAFAAFTFGPLSALLAGGIGTALADLIGSYVQWAPISLLVHGAQGLVIGLIARARPHSIPVYVLAGLAGVLVMAGGYFAGGILLTGMGPALLEVPGNLVQSAAGVIVGIPLSLAVIKAYPPVRNIKW